MQTYTKQFKDWREEGRAPTSYTVLSNVRNQETKLKFVSLWAGKEARTVSQHSRPGQEEQSKDYARHT